MFSVLRVLYGCILILALAACGTPSPRPAVNAEYSASSPRLASAAGREVALYALALMDTDYRFGGKNPQAGLDCSGMVSYIFGQAAGLRITGNAAAIAVQGRPIARSDLLPGDLVFFNTRNRSLSHVGIYIGDARFVHAPSQNGKVRIDRLDSPYFARRYEAARSYFD